MWQRVDSRLRCSRPVTRIRWHVASYSGSATRVGPNSYHRILPFSSISKSSSGIVACSLSSRGKFVSSCCCDVMDYMSLDPQDGVVFQSRPYWHVWKEQQCGLNVAEVSTQDDSQCSSCPSPYVCSFLAGCQPMQSDVEGRAMGTSRRRLTRDSKQTDRRRYEIVNGAIPL
jgi:hypothetical protein